MAGPSWRSCGGGRPSPASVGAPVAPAPGAGQPSAASVSALGAGGEFAVEGGSPSAPLECRSLGARAASLPPGAPTTNGPSLLILPASPPRASLSPRPGGETSCGEVCPLASRTEAPGAAVSPGVSGAGVGLTDEEASIAAAAAAGRPGDGCHLMHAESKVRGERAPGCKCVVRVREPARSQLRTAAMTASAEKPCRSHAARCSPAGRTARMQSEEEAAAVQCRARASVTARSGTTRRVGSSHSAWPGAGLACGGAGTTEAASPRVAAAGGGSAAGGRLWLLEVTSGAGGQDGARGVAAAPHRSAATAGHACPPVGGPGAPAGAGAAC